MPAAHHPTISCTRTLILYVLNIVAIWESPPHIQADYLRDAPGAGIRLIKPTIGEAASGGVGHWRPRLLSQCAHCRQLTRRWCSQHRSVCMPNMFRILTTKMRTRKWKPFKGQLMKGTIAQTHTVTYVSAIYRCIHWVLSHLLLFLDMFVCFTARLRPMESYVYCTTDSTEEALSSTIAPFCLWTAPTEIFVWPFPYDIMCKCNNTTKVTIPFRAQGNRLLIMQHY